MTNRTGKTIHREFWENRLVEIFDEGDTRSLYFGGRYLQSRMSLNSPHLLSLLYTHYMMFALLFRQELRNVLLIGLGAGSLVRFLHHHFPMCTIDAVDHSPHIINLARGYFQLPESSNIHIHCCDGFRFLADTKMNKAYDLILIDAFDEQGMSAQIYSEDFFSMCANVLHPLGTLTCNMWSGNTQFLSELSSILNTCFTSRVVLPVPKRGNVINHLRKQSIDWSDVHRSRQELLILVEKFNINFPQMVNVAEKHNLNLSQRVMQLFSNFSLH